MAMMLDRALQVDYPAVDLALIAQLYVAPWRIKYAGAFGPAADPTSGIVPGSGQANHLARVVLYNELERVHWKVPRAMLRQFVDDIVIRTEGTEATTTQDLTRASRTLLVGLHSAELMVSESTRWQARTKAWQWKSRSS